VAVVGSYDTKREELEFLAAGIRAAGAEVLTVDTSLRGGGAEATADVSAERLACLAGTTREAIAEAPRGEAVERLGAGLAKLGEELVAGGVTGAFVGIGGGTAAALFGHLTRALPLGVPKLLVSTVAAGTPSRFVGLTDTFVLYPVADIEGLNALTRSALAQAGLAAAGLAGHRPAAAGHDGRSVAATMFGVTTPCVSACRKLIERDGSEVIVFHATGSGGRSYEELLGAGRFGAALDLTLTEIADEVVGGILPAGSDRLTAAARLGTPQVVVPGAVDVVNFAAPASVPERFAGRTLLAHNPHVTLMRSDVEESRRIGETIAGRLAHRSARATVVLPRGGVSALDVEGGPFWSPDADEALFEAILESAPPWVKVVESEHHINDPAFAEIVVQALEDRIRTEEHDRETTREGAPA
jgi:uncharacterized protein (UPF0261 family)